MTEIDQQPKNILVVDCCKHIVSALDRVLDFNLIILNTRNKMSETPTDIELDFIVVGVSNVPVRKIFIGRLRRFYPRVPMLVMHRETFANEAIKEQIRGEFILADNHYRCDLELVKIFRSIFPLKFCHHIKTELNHDLVSSVMRIIEENYADQRLDIEQVAEEVPVAVSKLSRILNKQIGINFRSLLKQIRIEQAKKMLSSHMYSVKEVSASVGFSDSHYFSRVFKQTTGINATQYKESPHDLIFD